MNPSQHKWRRLLAVLLAVAVVAAACGSDSDDTATTSGADDDATATTEAMADDDDSGDDDATATTAAPADDGGGAAAMISDECNIPEPADGVTIDVIAWEFPVIAEYAAEAEECNSDNLEVNVQLLASADAQDQITLDLSTGSPEFEVVMTTDSTVGTHADNLVDLTPFIEKYRDEFDLGDIPDSFWNGAMVDGKILGVPLDSNTMHFFYNTEIFAENGITPPDNYDEVIAACGVLKEAGFDDAFNMNLSANWAWEIEFSNVIKSLGGTVVNDDNTPGWNTPEGVEAVNKIVEISEACMTDAGRSFGIDDAEAALRSGELPMATIWASRAAQMDDPENSLVVDVIEFLPSIRTTPDSLRNGPAFVDYWSIPAGSSVDPEIVFQLLMATTDLESQNAAAAHAAVSRLSATNADAPRNGAASQTSVAEGVGARIKNPALPVAQGALGDALLEITASGADPAQALADAEARYIDEATAAGFLS
ncbi:MAG: ABC transporter substrate-binding protein [Acidimicrobiales bacterium]